MNSPKQVSKLLLIELKDGNKTIDDVFDKMEKSGYSEKLINDTINYLKEDNLVEIDGNHVKATPKGFLKTIEHLDDVPIQDLTDLEQVIAILNGQGPLSTLAIAKIVKGLAATKSMINNILYKGLRCGALMKVADDVWDVVSALKIEKKQLSPCFYCGDKTPNHIGKNCPKRNRDKCLFCKQDNPDHDGKDCPLNPKKTQPSSNEILPPRSREAFVYAVEGQERVATSIDEVINNISQIGLDPNKIDLSRYSAVERDPLTAEVSREASEKVFQDRLREVEGHEKKLVSNRNENPALFNTGTQRIPVPSVLREVVNAAYDAPMQFANFTAVERDAITAEISAQLSEQVFQKRLRDIKLRQQFEEQDKLNPVNVESLAPKDLEYEFFLRWTRSSSIAQYLRSLFLFEFNGDNSKKFVMFGEKLATTNLIKMCLDDNKEQRLIQPFINEHIGANILGKDQPSHMKSSIAQIVSAAVVTDEKIGRLLYSILGALFYRRGDYTEMISVHKNMMEGGLWF